jgi:endonuclease/exonuclease/phosphatase family metal-dependent hydrolase
LGGERLDVVDAPSKAERQRWFESLGDQHLHRALMDQLPCLRQTEGRGASGGVGGRTGGLSGWVRIVAWNVERGKDPPSAAALLKTAAPDVVLLSELDSGMARTSDVDVPGVLASALGMGYVYGVEFIELVGDNERGLHGNAVVTSAAIADPAVVRLDEDGHWFDAGSPQPRVGGRIGVYATVWVDEAPVRVASTHLENVTDAEGRATQLDRLLDVLGSGPAVVGGDLNTFGVPLEELADHVLVRQRRATEPARFSWPVAHEPLFGVAAAHGFEWVDANVVAPTTSHDPTGIPGHVPLKLDWILVRGLEARRPAVAPAAGLSDHTVVSVSVRLPPA